jgi:hypothetical protein
LREKENSTMKKRKQILEETGCKLGGINKNERMMGVSQSQIIDKLNVPTQFLPFD